MKKGKETIDSSEKMFWIMGSAWIIFLVLVLVSVLILHQVREKSVNFEEKMLEQTTYETLEDGTKKNVSNRLGTAQIKINQLEFSHFAIQQKGINSDITFEVINHDKAMDERKSFNINLYDVEDKELTKFTLNLEKLPVGESILFRQNLEVPCVTADRVEVQQVDMGLGK